jgi:hypothetical protein
MSWPKDFLLAQDLFHVWGFPLITEMKPYRLSRYINYAHDGNHFALPTPFAHFIPMSGITANYGAYTSSQSFDTQEKGCQNLFPTYLFGWLIISFLELFIHGVHFDDYVARSLSCFRAGCLVYIEFMCLCFDVFDVTPQR